MPARKLRVRSAIYLYVHAHLRYNIPSLTLQFLVHYKNDHLPLSVAMLASEKLAAVAAETSTALTMD